jgi:glycosyltransferase involved in cell wall biosynthesis
MILLQNISEGDLKFIDDINECLTHNMSNFQIEKIVIFSNVKDIETKIGIDRNSKRVILIKVDPNHLDIIKYGKKKSKDYIIYSTPFIKFNDISSIMKKVYMDSIAKEPYSYYIFRRDVKVFNGKTIDDILLGSKIKSDLNIQRFGYYSVPNFPIKSIGWDITRNYKEDVVLKKSATPRVDIPVEKALTPQVSEKIQVVEKVLVPEKIQVVEKIKGPKRVGSRKIDVVIVSVNYNDFLLISLENNSKIFENITVVTSSSDFLCQKICKKFGVKCVVTDIMYEDRAPFNKGKAINAGIDSISDTDYILLLDADILVMNKIFLDSLDDELLYTSDRYIVADYDSYQRYISGGLNKDDEFMIDMNQGLGFFQLFNSYMRVDYPESSKDASLCDIIFRDKFDKSVAIDNTILHLGNDSNWKGRRSKSFLDFDSFDFLLEKKSDFKICTFYYNPENDLVRKENFLKFLDQFEGYEEKLLIGMVDYDDYELPILEKFEKCIFTIKGDKNNPIWYKEILLNKMVDSIDVDYVIWMDCDLIYESLDWLENIDSIVRGKDFVQLYDKIDYLDENGLVLESYKSILSSDRVYGVYDERTIDHLMGEGYKPGGSWVGKTSILKNNKLYERMYVGGGDSIFLYGLLGIKGAVLENVKRGSRKIYRECIDWINGFGKYTYGYLTCTIKHLYHGDLNDRNYDGRYKRLSSIEKNLECKSKINIKSDSILDRGLINRTFDKVYCLNLNRRIDRWESMQEKLKSLGIKAKRFEAIDGDEIDAEILSKYSINKYAVGCIFSHYEIIKDAKLKKYKNILIIEDDVLFSDNFLEEFERKMKMLNSWKMIYLGCSQYDWDVDIIDGFYNSKNSLGTFAYAIDRSLYDEILDTDNIRDTPIDNILSIIQNKHYGECYNFFPNIIIADVSESDIRGGRVMINHSKKMRWEIDKFKNNKPFFSIVIPTYNSKYLIETLDSVQSQTIDDYECIVVDDGSIDDLSEIESLYKNTKVYKRPDYLNKNANSCRNYGVYMSKGKYIIFLDSDDCLASNCLENRKSKISEDMSCSLHIFKMGRFSKNINDNINQLVNKKPLKAKIVDDFLSYNILWPITAATWKREDLYKVGGFDENINRFQDFDIHIRFLLSCDNYIIYENVDIDCYYRNSEFHINITEARKKIITESAQYLINRYKEYGVDFNIEFFQYLKKRYNYESNVYQF